MDLPEASERWKTFKEKLQAHGIEPFCMSAVKSEGTHEVICAAYELVRKRIEDNKEGGWKYILVSSLYCIAEFFPSLVNMLIYWCMHTSLGFSLPILTIKSINMHCSCPYRG